MVYINLASWLFETQQLDLLGSSVDRKWTQSKFATLSAYSPKTTNGFRKNIDEIDEKEWVFVVFCGM